MAVTWPRGFRSAGVACGIKSSGDPDLGVIVTGEPALWAGAFTKNAAAAPAVGWCKSHLSHRVRAVVVNSGNANACAGEAGHRAVGETVVAAAAAIGCEPDSVLVASTGTIGIALPADKVVAALPATVAGLSESIDAFAGAILTTDTHPKVASHHGSASIVGVAKGAAMVAPNMATMLAFVATDAQLSQSDLDAALKSAVGSTFDRICVDACESTNDSVICLSSGIVPVDVDEFTAGLEDVCADLARQIVGDAEGSTRIIRIRVAGATDENAAAGLGRAVAASTLWRAAVHGSDPNWGRVLAAMGSVDRELAVDEIEVSLGDAVVFRRGEPLATNGGAHAAMKAGEVVVTCIVGKGPGAAEILSADLSPDYVTLNAEGST
jgi:glutamate N-acetyltransferase/amino-acid N-acetyltransferase